MCSTYQSQKPRCNTSTAFHDLIFIKRVQEKMEKLRHSTQRSIFGVAFKLNVSQRKLTVTEKKKRLNWEIHSFIRTHVETNWRIRYKSHCSWEKNSMIICILIWNKQKIEQLYFEDLLENPPLDILSILSSLSSEVVPFLICGVTSPAF